MIYNPPPAPARVWRYEKTSGAAPNLKIRVRAGARAKLPLEIAQDLKNEANEHFNASRWHELGAETRSGRLSSASIFQ